ncbi:SGNH/GDSL hydrolase family protein [Amycolatopsis orientalis]|uniref:SGNH/GDSL hydrolase family protein n=1 Tax=Amycolatopsis orientalis TaxID=31958 RepID=UPI0003A4F689|nr:SGNH/GDSL hydrolase family protein [Amycolatopsis orientalis]
MNRKPVARWAVAVVAFAAAVLGCPSASAAPAPTSMAALGDSMTRAFNTCLLPWTDCVRNSWATGTAIDSYYQRSRMPAGANHNFAVSGARMNDLPRQAKAAVASRVGLVTVLMGNNDACSGGTSVETFAGQFKEAMSTLRQGLPGAQVKVVSIPDIYQLWDILHTDKSAVAKWGTFHECDALLANPTSTAPADQQRREAFRQRIVDYNAELAAVCAEYAQCEYDGGAGFAARFDPSDVSTVDYFHPSVQGQALIADVAWKSLGY